MPTESDVNVHITVVPKGRVSWTLSFQRDNPDVEPRNTDFYNEPPTASQDLFLTDCDLVV